MQISLDFVKRKLVELMQDQLKSKQRFNMVAFNNKVYPWRDRLVEVDTFNVNSASEWIASLSAQGSTNTLAAIRFALAELKTEAIYLLTDGRPDQVTCLFKLILNYIKRTHYVISLFIQKRSHVRFCLSVT